MRRLPRTAVFVHVVFRALIRFHNDSAIRMHRNESFQFRITSARPQAIAASASFVWTRSSSSVNNALLNI